MSTLNIKQAGTWTPIAGDVAASNPVNDQLAANTNKLNTIDTDVFTFAPTFNTASGGPNLGNAVLGCWYHRIGKLVHVVYFIQFGSTSNGGVGAVTWGLPPGFICAKNSTGICKLYHNGNASDWTGVVYAAASEPIIHPLFPMNGTSSNLGAFRGSSDGNPGNGIPQVGGQYTIAPSDIFQADVWITT